MPHPRGVRTRKVLRHPNIDYGPGSWFFVTVCASRRGAIFGTVFDGVAVLNAAGQTVARHLDAIREHFATVVLDDRIVMPDHVHVIVGLEGRNRPWDHTTDGSVTSHARARQASPLRLGTVVGSFKAGVSRELGIAIWQRGYFDHRIRDERDLDACRAYIRGNPFRWTSPRNQ